jgi:hypothetical protein
LIEVLTILNVYVPSTHGNTIEVVEGFCMALEDKIKRAPETNIPILV